MFLFCWAAGFNIQTGSNTKAPICQFLGSKGKASPTHAASAAFFTLLAQLATFKIRTSQLLEKRS
jgi:hypothetical protein